MQPKWGSYETRKRTESIGARANFKLSICILYRLINFFATFICFTSLFNSYFTVNNSSFAKHTTFYLKLTITLLNKSILQGVITVVSYGISIN